jgi:NADH-ubiquinone oxidoreductase chain 3
VLIFTGIITVGFVFELGKNALKIDSRQSVVDSSKNSRFLSTFSQN